MSLKEPKQEKEASAFVANADRVIAKHKSFLQKIGKL